MVRKSHGEILLLAVTGAISTCHIQPDHWNTTDCEDNSSPKFLFLLLIPHLGFWSQQSPVGLFCFKSECERDGVSGCALNILSKSVELKKSDRNLTSSKPAFLVIYYWSDCDLHKTKMESDAQKNRRRQSNHTTMVLPCSTPLLLLILQQVKVHHAKVETDFFFLSNCFFFWGSVGLKSDRSDMYPAGYSNLAWIQQHHAALWAVSTWKHPELRAQHANPSCLSRSVGSYPAQLSETPSLICPSCYWIRLHTHKHTLTFRHGEVWRREWKGSAREEKTEEPETTTDDAWGSDRSWCIVLFD